ncbi:MAG TPA: hybrid sensor histidine kinase/response regulator, partial [Rhizomicrobium sp.]|nr:hybrid sensor histidine kinase/response regulator [Rhizomicrobium sp.]
MASGRAETEFFYVLDEPLHLLFVDDDPILCEFAKVHLASEKGQVSVAGDGEEALTKIRAHGADLILLDLEMPRLDGFGVLEALRGDEATKRLPVIVITGREDVVAIDRAFAMGASSFIVKPINWRLLNYQIRFVDRAHRAEQQLLDRVSEVELTKRELERTSTDLVEASRGAAKASEAKAQFLAAISHELRTPLNAIIGFAEMLNAQALGPIGNARYLRYATDIRDSGAHLLAMINDILELSRMDAGQVTLQDDVFALADVVGEALRMVEPQAEAAKLSLSTVLPPDLAHLRADRRLVRQALVNVLANAVRFTPAGGAVSVHGFARNGQLCCEVCDTGIGIAPENIARALERFSQVDGTLARTHDGAGLGLPMAKQFVELHDGSLELTSIPGKGTKVCLSFPP